ncbi:MAG: ABC transporter permease, partial [Candidatus Thorarchaeota archaeon]|nr:ABC transporter permease [Candidatus Thorarchaeota archaeon]
GIQGFLILILGWLGLQVSFGIKEMSPPSFSWAMYLNIAMIVISLTLGFFTIPFVVVSVILIVLLFTPEVKNYWYPEYMEDMRPRMKETRYSMYLIRKSPLVLIGVVVIAFMVSLAVFAPFITPYGGEERIWADARAAPGAESNDPNVYKKQLFKIPHHDIDILPSFYSGEFTISPNETQTTTNPLLRLEVDFENDRLEGVNLTVEMALYTLNLTMFNSLSEAGRATYFVDGISAVLAENESLDETFRMSNATTAYVWTLSFDAPQKTRTWLVNARMELDLKLPDYPVHIWGADNYGGDVFSRIIWGAQTDIRIALTVVAVALSIGAVIGAASGYYGGKLDELVMRITDVFFAFPGLILAMAIVMALGQRNLDNISIALMITWWPAYARLVRGQVLSEREKLYVEAARSVGASDTRILLFHIIPNTIQPVIVQATMDIGGVLLTAAGLSYIGFGPPVGTPEWGLMIASGQEYLLSAPWMSTFPGLAILVTALAFNLVGDGIRDILDPKLRRR